MITVDSLVKKYGQTTAVNGMSFTVQPGRVTGFLGPNGAGKSTTMRCVLGLDRPTSGEALVNGRPFRDAPAPLGLVGSLLDGKAFDRNRSARNHLRSVGAANGVGRARVDEVLEVAGLTSVAKRSAGTFSLGMGQRLGIATALLGDPPIVILDEPVNGLDPDGITWIRQLTRQLADEGRTVFISSHLMSEMEMTADHLIIVGQGKVLADTSMSDFISAASGERVDVVSPDVDRLTNLLARPEVTLTRGEAGVLEVDGLSAQTIGELAAANGVVLHQLVTKRLSLEDAFMTLTNSTVEFHGHPDRISQ